MTVREAAPLLGLSADAVYALCEGDTPQLSHRRVGPKGGKITIEPEDVAEYLARCRRAARGPAVRAAGGGEGRRLRWITV